MTNNHPRTTTEADALRVALARLIEMIDAYTQSPVMAALQEHITMRQARAALSSAAQPAAVPPGYVLTPVEPSDKMVQAALHIDLSYMPGQDGADRAAVYRAMLAAAPKAAPAPAPSVTYTELPDFDTVEQRIYAGCRRFISGDMLEPIHDLIREAIDADRAFRGQAPAAQEAALHYFDAGWKAAARFCDREDAVADGIIGHGACPQFERAFDAARAELAGKNLACWCSKDDPYEDACHAAILLSLANNKNHFNDTKA